MFNRPCLFILFFPVDFLKFLEMFSYQSYVDNHGVQHDLNNPEILVEFDKYILNTSKMFKIESARSLKAT